METVPFSTLALARHAPQTSCIKSLMSAPFKPRLVAHAGDLCRRYFYALTFTFDMFFCLPPISTLGLRLFADAHEADALIWERKKNRQLYARQHVCDRKRSFLFLSKFGTFELFRIDHACEFLFLKCLFSKINISR